MKTKLEIGREYWLDNSKDESGTFIGLDGSTILFKPSKNCVSYCLRNGYVVFGDTGREYCEVVTEKPWQFTTPIAMKCTEEQFNWIKDKLVEMGYKLSISCDLIDGIWLVNNFGGVSNCFGLACGTPFQKTKFNSFNPNLFLALAAMTDKEDGIKGEWWKSDRGFAVQGVSSVTGLKLYRKATAQEIIEHFIEDNNRLKSNYATKNIQKVWNESIEHVKGNIDIPIPPTKQATLFDDRVEITDWKPKEGEAVWVVSRLKNSFEYKKYIFDASIPFEDGEKVSPFIKRTESEAKQLVEKLKQAML